MNLIYRYNEGILYKTNRVEEIVKKWEVGQCCAREKEEYIIVMGVKLDKGP